MKKLLGANPMQVKSLLTAVAMALLATTAPAFAALELNCGAPRLALGDDPRDFNPVVSVEVRYIPEDHAWRIFHNRRDGLVVSRVRSDRLEILGTETDPDGQAKQLRDSARRLRRGILFIVVSLCVWDVDGRYMSCCTTQRLVESRQRLVIRRTP